MEKYWNIRKIRDKKAGYLERKIKWIKSNRAVGEDRAAHTRKKDETYRASWAAQSYW